MLDLAALTRALAQGPVARVVVADHEGSAPREAGASMLVTAMTTWGTIGGGALEHQATQQARALLHSGHRAPRVDRIPLGPALGQCCGGAVTLVTEIFTTAPEGPLHAIALDPQSPMPLAVKRALSKARSEGTLPRTQILQGWLLDPVQPHKTELWLWGAGHVGRAIAATLAPLPDLQITWIDISADRFPPESPGIRLLPTPDPAQAVRLAPPQAHHLIVTFSHSLDLELCHRLLTHGFASCGLIGSATKWARFRARLRSLGQDPSPITCPIGDPAFGKHPQAIAIGVAARLLRATALSPSSVQKYPTGGSGRV